MFRNVPTTSREGKLEEGSSAAVVAVAVTVLVAEGVVIFFVPEPRRLRRF